MGQVPAFGIVGDGRVARHFTHYLSLLGVEVRSWSRRSARGAPPHDAVGACHTVLLLLRDEAIVPFIETWPALRRTRLVHFSGTVATALAEPAHPLMTFGPDLYDLDTYKTIPFVLETGRPPFDELLPGLPNPWFAIPARERPYYHALCVLAGNFSVLLWQKLFREFEQRLGIPASAAHPYASRVIANVVAGGQRALTGPLARHDTRTIESNLKALDGDAFQAVYAAFVRAYEHGS